MRELEDGDREEIDRAKDQQRQQEKIAELDMGPRYLDVPEVLGEDQKRDRRGEGDQPSDQEAPLAKPHFKREVREKDVIGN